MAGKRKKSRKKVRRKARRRNQVPTTLAWRKKWEAGTGKKIKRAKKPSASLKAYKSGMQRAFAEGKMSAFRESVLKGVGKVSTRPKRKKRRKAKKRVVRKKRAVAKRRRSPARKAANPRRKRRRTRRRRNVGSVMNMLPAMRRYRRPRRRGVARYNSRNPVTATVKQMLSGKAMSDYAYITGGFVAGAILPRFINKALAKVGIAVPGGMVADMLLGIGTSVAAGTATAIVTKDVNKGKKVTAGGLAGVIGAALVRYIDMALPMSGLGQTAEVAIRSAVDEELRRAGLKGLGQFITTSEVAESPEVSGTVGQFLTTAEVEYAPEVSGLDQDITEGAQAFDGFEGDNF
jgi:hypothetical protein